ncbi:MAG: hypothetical protein IJT59_02470, partial [Desulfovibrionaceae bacterium]|nr:hypothetical protein [Desulfovibrionaceae bacterium]
KARMDIRLLDGTKVNASVGYKNLRLLEMRKKLSYRTKKGRLKAVPPTGKPVGFPAENLMT